MMGTGNPQRTFFYSISLETFGLRIIRCARSDY